MQNTLPTSTTAPLTNVALCMSTMERAINRNPNLPGIVVFYGFSGFGKSFSAAYTANEYNAYYVECRSCWTAKAIMQAITKEMGILPDKTISGMLDQVTEEISLSGRPLIIDEADYLVQKSKIDLIRDIYDLSTAPIMLIGEEGMPRKLKKWERFDGRILDKVAAQPASLSDAQHLVGVYANGIDIHDDLLQAVHTASAASVRRICVNIDNIRQEASAEGWSSVDLAQWGDRGFFTGKVPKARSLTL